MAAWFEKICCQGGKLSFVLVSRLGMPCNGVCLKTLFDFIPMGVSFLTQLIESFWEKAGTAYLIKTGIQDKCDKPKSYSVFYYDK